MYAKAACLSAERVRFMRQRVRSRFKQWKKHSANALSCQFLRLIVMGTALCHLTHSCHSNFVNFGGELIAKNLDIKGPRSA